MTTTPTSEPQPYGWISTLLYSFGSEAPEEVFWGINELVDWLNKTHGFQLEPLIHPYSPEAESDEYDEEERVQAIVQALKMLQRVT